VSEGTGAKQRAEILNLVRESNEYDLQTFEVMIEQHRGAFGHDPHVTWAADLALAPLLNPASVPGATVLGTKRTKAILFTRDETQWHLYVLGSAARQRQGEDNEFAEILLGIAEQLEPRVIRTVSPTRLARSLHTAGKLVAKLPQYVDAIHLPNGVEIVFGTPQGDMMWSMFTLLAAWERDEIVRRNFTGKVIRLVRGEWIFGPDAVPPGYIWRSDTRTVSPDPRPEVRQRVAAMIELLARDDLTDRECAEQLGQIGITSPRLQKMYGDDATYGDARSHWTAIERLLSWLDLYETGSFDVVLMNQIPGLQTVAGVPVEPHPDAPHGVLRVRMHWGLP